MPTRKDNTNVARIYKEQIVIPASGATLLKQQARPKVAGRPVSSGAIEIVSPEFDLLTGIRGIANLPKGFLKTNKLPQGENLYYRQLDKSSKGLERAKQVGVIDTKSSGGANFTTSRGTTLRIGKTFDTPFFAKGSLWYNNVDDMDVIVGKDNPLLDWKMITQHGRVTENTMKAANRRTPFYNGATNQAPTELFELYRRYPGIGYRNVTYGFPTIPIIGLNTAAEQMKCGGRRKAQLGLGDNNVPTQEEYIAQQIAAKRAAALDKSRNRTSVRVPMIPNPMTEEQWRNYVNNNIRLQEEQLSRIMSRYDQYKNRYGIRAIQDEQEALDKYLEEKDKGYPKLVPGSNCMYNAGDCYGLNIPGNLTFAAKHKELGFKKAPKGSMEPGDIVQDVSTRKPIHAMIYDSKDSEGNLLFNYARGDTGDDAFDINENYIKQGKYTIPIKDFDVYKYVGTPADSTQWINEYKQKYGKGMRCGGRRKAQLGLDIREGGIAIPIAPNMYYMDGRSHDNGGIAIGPNNKNGLEVEGGEVVKVGKNDVKVFSSVPFLRGVSPAQLVMGGANPNTVFEAQEKFKDRNRINDDGTRYKIGGEKIYTPSKAIQQQIQETGRVTIGGAPTIGGLRTYSYIKGLANVRKYSNAATNIFRIGKELIRRGTEKLVDNGKISRNIAQIPRSIYSQFIGRDGQNLPKTISLINNNMEEKRYGGNMIYTINGNVKNGLLSARPKAKYGLASKYLKKKNKTTQKPVETKQKEEHKILDIRNTAGYKVKQIAENPWIKYPVEVASYLLTGATAKGMQTGTKIVSKTINKIDDILGKPRQEYLSRNVSDKTISYTANSKSSVGNTYKATSKDLSRAKKEVQNRPTINDLAEARSTVGNIPQHTTISYNPSTRNPVSTISYFNVKNTRLPNIERFGRKQMDAKTSRELDKVYRKAVGNKEPKSGFGRIPQQTTIEYIPKSESVTAYDASVEFHKRISNMLYDGYVKKYGKKAVDKAMKREGISKYEYGGRIKAKDGKFLKYKNGVFTDPDSGEEYDVDPEVFKMYGNTKESGVIPTDDYTKGTFDNARPQYYAEKRFPIAGSQSIAEKAGLARSGWSYADSPTFDYVPKINISVPTNRVKVVGDNAKKSTSSTPRRGESKSTVTTKTKTEPAYINYTPNEVSLAVKADDPTSRTLAKVNTSSTGGGTQSKDGRWIGQYKPVTTGDWIGLAANGLGSISSYLLTKSGIDKMPDPIKPIMASAAKLKTRYNVEPQLTNVREAELTNRASVRRNTQSSNTSLTREQRLMNEARNASNTLYGQKENIETQLINQDRLNRQSVMRDNVRAYNDYLNRLTATRQGQNQLRISNVNNLISGLTGNVNNILSTIESRRTTNNTIRAIAAANPNVDARLIGGFDYYIDPVTKKMYNKNQQYVRTING